MTIKRSKLNGLGCLTQRFPPALKPTGVRLISAVPFSGKGNKRNEASIKLSSPAEYPYSGVLSVSFIKPLSNSSFNISTNMPKMLDAFDLTNNVGLVIQLSQSVGGYIWSISNTSCVYRCWMKFWLCLIASSNTSPNILFGGMSRRHHILVF